MGAVKGKSKKTSVVSKAKAVGSKLLGKGKGKGTGRRKETVIGLQNKILKLKLKKKLMKLRYGGS